ncbi:MAG: hypothetical protein ACJA2W_000864 [Planctomycetota bacterium]|jgi:hypothetical protein
MAHRVGELALGVQDDGEVMMRLGQHGLGLQDASEARLGGKVVACKVEVHGAT